MVDIAQSAAEAAETLAGCRFLSAEWMYQPRPTEPRRQRVFDTTLASRLSELRRYERSAVVFIGNNEATIDSLAHLHAQFPGLTQLAAIANPRPISAADHYAQTPVRCGWDEPVGWRRYDVTDRWARILFALDVARRMPGLGYLLMPAHDAVWGRGLLTALTRFSARQAQNGLPAAVSPYTPFHHSHVPGVDISPDIIAALNAAFARDGLLRWRLRLTRYQSFWGKMGMLPFAMTGAILPRLETMVWEDDLEMDRAIREAGYRARALWVDNPALYRQALPVFDRDGLRHVIERTLHYSLNIPGKTVGDKSGLTQPLDGLARLRRWRDPRFARALALSEAIVEACLREIEARLETCGASWVDWGAYRYVVRVGDPQVQVWKYERGML